MQRLFLTLLLIGTAGRLLSQAAGSAEFFETRIRPIFVSHCAGCHSPKLKTANLDLTSIAGIAAAQPDRVLAAVSYEQRVKMPPTGKLPGAAIEDLRAWINAGAVLPAYKVAAASAVPDWPPARRNHWAFQPVRKHPVPASGSSAVDAFILAKLKQAGLPAPKPADKLTLLRRAKFDLLGLPPTEEEIQSFLADSSPHAFAALIDKFLASPQYGERWARHWLDVARYADTAGVDENTAYSEAWRYREYVIDAFNRDLPFSQFVQEQIAGDLLPAADGAAVNARGIVATGFLGLGPKAIVEIDKRKEFYDVVDEQIDTTSKAFLGLTVSCARCHDHKFDPISTRDYYSMAAIFSNTQSYEQQVLRGSTVFTAPLVDKQTYATFKAHQARIAAKNMQAAALLETALWSASEARLFPRIAEYMAAAWKVRHRKSDAAAIAGGENLDPSILSAWVKYLNPDGGFRPHLKQWMDATESTVPAVAREYAGRFQATASLWGPILTKWKANTAAAVRGEGTLPKTPNIEYGDPATRAAFNEPSTRFFIDVVIPARTLNDRTSVDGPFVIPEARHKEFLPETVQAELGAIRKESEALTASSPPAPPVANAVGEGPSVTQHVFVRGNYDNPGPAVERGFPEIIRGTNSVTSSGSGRKDLGQWLVNPANPLTARVIVNRIWGWHFGDGLVRTPNNFGLTGEAPTHPELLDHLAAAFIESGWSMKAMHRTLMLSSIYQSSSETTPEAWRVDPANRLWSRFKRRRMEIEEIRDSWLQLSGTLLLRMGGIFDRVDPPPAPRRGRGGAQGPQPFDASKRRTIYLPVNRNGLATPMALNDFVDSTTSAGHRPETIIAPQALYLMNNAFVTGQAASFARQVLSAPNLTDAEYVRRAWRLAFTREPDGDDIRLAIEYLRNYPAQPDAWASYCRVLLSANQMHFID